MTVRNYDPAEVACARGALASFTPEKPMILGAAVYRDMKATGLFDDMMDRVLVVELIRV